MTFPPAAARRVMNEQAEYYRTQPDGYYLYVEESDVRNVHFLVVGMEGTPYAGGEYVGQITLPDSYPDAPPDFTFHTPNGRFVPGDKICLSMSSRHTEKWMPVHTLMEMVDAVRWMMMDPQDEDETTGIGSAYTSAEVKQQHAVASKAWNRAHCDLYDMIMYRPEMEIHDDTESSSESEPSNDYQYDD
jgi:ubiquitin-conjugating enzyme E2 J2